MTKECQKWTIHEREFPCTRQVCKSLASGLWLKLTNFLLFSKHPVWVIMCYVQERNFSLTVVTFRFSPGESYLWLKNVSVRFCSLFPFFPVVRVTFEEILFISSIGIFRLMLSRHHNLEAFMKLLFHIFKILFFVTSTIL